MCLSIYEYLHHSTVSFYIISLFLVSIYGFTLSAVYIFLLYIVYTVCISAVSVYLVYCTVYLSTVHINLSIHLPCSVQISLCSSIYSVYLSHYLSIYSISLSTMSIYLQCVSTMYTYLHYIYCIYSIGLHDAPYTVYLY